jgi:hypothetical protein
MTRPVLAEFFAHEVDEYVRLELLTAIDELATGRRYFTYNVFNVLLDADGQIATVEDELDVQRSETVPLGSFGELLRTMTT